jgi:predicted alpha/beta-hydrolase family hydrolase
MLGPVEMLLEGPQDAPLLVLAPGAGGRMDSPWFTDFARLMTARGIRTARFEFAYQAARRAGTRAAQPRAEAVTDEYRAVVAELGQPIVIGGKSFGGRVASMVADQLGVAGLVCLGYPFHPPSRPGQLRTAHLERLHTPALICQGTRDPFGTREEVPAYRLSPAIEVHWLEDGDHDLRPRKAVSGRTFAQNLNETADAVAAFLDRVSG